MFIDMYIIYVYVYIVCTTHVFISILSASNIYMDFKVCGCLYVYIYIYNICAYVLTDSLSVSLLCFLRLPNQVSVHFFLSNKILF